MLGIIQIPSSFSLISIMDSDHRSLSDGCLLYSVVVIISEIHMAKIYLCLSPKLRFSVCKAMIAR